MIDKALFVEPHDFEETVMNQISRKERTMKEHSLTIHFCITRLSLKNYQGQTCKVDVAFHYQNDDGNWRSRSYEDISPSSQVNLFALLDGKNPASEVYAYGKHLYNKTRHFEVSFEDITF